MTQSNGDLIAEGHALVNLANVRFRLYQLDLAEKTAYEALKIGEQTGDLRLLTSVHACRGGLLIMRGQLDQATAHYDEVLKDAEVLGESGTLLDTLRLSAYQAIWAGQYQDAETYACRALGLAQKTSRLFGHRGSLSESEFRSDRIGTISRSTPEYPRHAGGYQSSGAHHHQKPRLLNLHGLSLSGTGRCAEALGWDQKALEAIRDTHYQASRCVGTVCLIRQRTMCTLAK